MRKSNFYQRLAVPMRADPAEILLAYRRIMFTVDLNVGARPDPEQYRDIQDAYLVLSNPDRRRAHDIELLTGRRTSRPRRRDGNRRSRFLMISLP